MPTVPVPLFSKSYKATDGSVLSDDSYVQYNGYLDELGGITIRPGELLALIVSRRNDGLYVWPDKDLIVSADDGQVSLLAASGTTLGVVAVAATALAPTGNPVIFASNGNLVFMASGSRIHYLTTAGVLTALVDADAPTSVTHIAFIDGYIIAIDGTGKFWWSDTPPAPATDWSATSFAEAEGSPDNTKAVYVVQRQIYLLGTTSTEIWENDGVNPFSRIPGGLIEMGCAAAYSGVKLDNSLIWLNHDREFVQFTGTSAKIISGRYAKELQEFGTVYDCIGTLIKKAGQVFVVFQFPTEDRTLVYNPALDDWSEWALWDSTTSRWRSYDIRSATKDLTTGQVFIGKGRAQVISCLSSNSHVDYTNSSTTAPFKFLRQTGFIDHGTNKKKRLEELRFRAKRGTTTSSTTVPKLMFRYRNDGNNTWSNIKEIDLGLIGQTNHHIKLNRLGVYKSRQFEISATDDVAIVLSNAEADITVLR